MGDGRRPDFVPLIALVEKAGRALRADLIQHAVSRGGGAVQASHHVVFATLPRGGARAADMAARAGITRQSMGEVVRDMTARGLLEMVPDPDDRRAKIVRFTPAGLAAAGDGFDRIHEIDVWMRREFGDEAFESTVRVLTAVPSLLAQPS